MDPWHLLFAVSALLLMLAAFAWLVVKHLPAPDRLAALKTILWTALAVIIGVSDTGASLLTAAITLFR